MPWIREIEYHPRGLPRQVFTIEISIPDHVVLEIFGPRLFDPYKKVWIDDDFEVVWPREITAPMAERLRPYVGGALDFDLDRYTYYLSTSQ